MIARRSTTDTTATAMATAAVAAAVLATVAFVFWRDASAHWSSAVPGHALGAVGVALMLWAAAGYSWRKRHIATGAAPMQAAMQGHIIAGLLGPYLVILHSGLAFRGLAGVLTLLTVLVVASGVVGRALYAAVPRRIDVADPVRAAMLDAEMARLEMQDADRARRGESDAAGAEALQRAMAAVRHEQALVQSQWRDDAGGGSRRALSGWWWLHVPLSFALWVVAAAHVAGTLYYATFSR
jgi:hypothetical protein